MSALTMCLAMMVTGMAVLVSTQALMAVTDWTPTKDRWVLGLIGFGVMLLFGGIAVGVLAI